MNTSDLVNIYMFNCISTKYKRNTKMHNGCESMVEEMNEIRNLLNYSTIEDTIKACICNRHGHQYCIRETAVTEAVKVIMDEIRNNANSKLLIRNNKLIGTFCDFEELYLFIKNLIGNVCGIGSLTIYDTAKRLGHIIDTPIYPKDYVYLTAGAAKGAKALLKISKINKKEPIDKFVAYFGSLPSIFIEDLLCVFHQELIRGLDSCFIDDLIQNAFNSLSKQTIYNTII